MKIGVLGMGNIGGTIGRKWQAAGHEVTFGVRNPQDRPASDGACVTSVADAIGGADALLLAVPGGTVEDLLKANASALDGRLIVDATNRIGGDSFHQLHLFDDLVPSASVYRAFNTLGWENFENPELGGERADLFSAGPDDAGRQTVEGLISDVGLRPIYVGSGTDAVQVVDGVARLWFALAFGQKRGRRLAFRVLEESG